MAAVIELHTGRNLADHHIDVVTRPPELRVIHGGRSQAARSLHRVHLIRRAAVVLAAIVVAVLAVQVLSMAGSASTAIAPAAAEQLGGTHVVRPGDSLWSLATRVDPDADLRDVVDELLELNAGSVGADGVLRAGQVLQLPVD